MRISDWSSDVCSSDLTLELPAEAFDLAYSSLAFHYVRDFGRLARVIRQALARGGRLVFTIAHPVFMAAAQPRWISDGQGDRKSVVEGTSVSVRVDLGGRRIIKKKINKI